MTLSRAWALSLLLLSGCFGDVELQKPQDPPAWPMGQARPDQGELRRRAEMDVAPPTGAPLEVPPAAAVTEPEPAKPETPAEAPKGEVRSAPVQPVVEKPPVP